MDIKTENIITPQGQGVAHLNIINRCKMTFTEFINDPRVWIGFLIAMGLLAVAFAVAWVYFYTKERLYYDLVDKEQEQRNRNKLNQLKRNR